MLFVGHTRFSLFAPRSSSWKASNGSKFTSADEYKAYLFQESRLDVRTEIFVQQSLPQIELGRGGHDVRHIVSYDSDLPPKYEAALEDAARRYSFLILDKQSIETTPITPESVAREIILRDPGKDVEQPFGMYRLDDDDLLPRDFFDQTAPYVTKAHVGMHVSLGTGITALYIDGKYYNVRRCHWPMIAIGLMNICAFDRDHRLRMPEVAPHSKSDRVNPVILDSRQLGYMWVRHVEQDTSLLIRAKDESGVLARVRADMDRHPPAENAEEIHAAFPVISDKVSYEPGPADKVHVLLNSSRKIPGNGLHLSSFQASGTMELRITLDCDDDAVDRNALVSFRFVDADGEVLDPATYKESMQAAGLSLSVNPRIGFFRYLRTAPGRQSATQKFNLPAGVFCDAITLRVWRRSETMISVQHVAVSFQRPR
ncbi:glycosyltransferase [uncultured Arthrobacter sp.]|uniref:glycosyltransferase n=1 Tax=uncultured Arthrobacter sp. TaxID=114050 RepID=UPI002639062D|nr:glycosyltransferase [uncultured Arthrobacter sp.]